MRRRELEIRVRRAALMLCLCGGLVAGARAQARFTSNTRLHRAGQIEWKHPLTVQYVITNTGTEPLVLTNVEPDCACTAAQWTQTPIAPGEKGTVDVTFDAEALGHFHKSVAIYTNATPHLVYLSMEGEVVSELKDYSLTHPFRIGQICIDKEEIIFPDIQHGERSTVYIDVVNLSDASYEPVLMHLPSYLAMKAEPERLPQGKRGRIALTLDPEKLPDLGLTQTSVYLSRFMGDKVSGENEIRVSMIKLPDFSGWTEAERLNAPAIRVSAESLDLSALLAKKKKVREDILLTNEGRSPLLIGKLQVSHPALGVSLKKTALRPGETARMRLTVTKKRLDEHSRHLRLLLITNDPKRPKVEVVIEL